MPVESAESHDALEHEFHAFALVRAEKLDEHVVDGDRRELFTLGVDSLPQHQGLDPGRELLRDLLRGLR